MRGVGQGREEGGQGRRTPFISSTPQNLKKDIRGALDQVEDIQLEILG